jgi:hypothetical protein
MKLVAHIIGGFLLGIVLVFLELLYKKNVFAILWYATRLWCRLQVAKFFRACSDWADNRLENLSNKPIPPLL